MEDNIELYNNEKSLQKKKNENSSHRRYPYGMILLRNAQSNTLFLATCSRNVRLNRLYQLQKAASLTGWSTHKASSLHGMFPLFT